MRALVVYESVFGNTREVALAVTAGLAEAGMTAEAVHAGDAPDRVQPVDLLVVGSPTHAFGLPRPETRADAYAKRPDVVIGHGPGVREWLERAVLTDGQPAIAFDVRMDHPRVITAVDHAARTTEKGLRSRGARVIGPAEHFTVTDMVGPLTGGEAERARSWGRALAGLIDG